jgi:hypothetical protein
MRAIELFEDQDDNGFEFRNSKQPSTHGLLLQGPFSKHSFFTIVLPFMANL